MQQDVEYGAQHFVGMRIFQLDYDKMLLQSLTGNGVDRNWYPGKIMHSICGNAWGHRHEHLKPALQCTCGIWSCKSRKQLAASFPMIAIQANQRDHRRAQGYFANGNIWFREIEYRYISAHVEQWGVVIEHQGGYRSEYARIIPESIQMWPRTSNSWRHRKLIKLLRAKYDVLEI